MFKEAIRRLARINESGTRLWQDTCKKSQSTEEITQPKDFNTRVYLKYNKILICDDQTNIDGIYETVLFSFLFPFKNITKC